MKVRSIILALTLLLSCNPEQKVEYESTDTAHWSDKEQELLILFNSTRGDALLRDDYCKYIAGLRTLEAIDNYEAFGQLSHNIELVCTLLTERDAETCAEILARGYPTVQQCYEAFMASESHRRTILGQGYIYVGIDIQTDNNGIYYYTAVFTR